MNSQDLMPGTFDSVVPNRSLWSKYIVQTPTLDPSGLGTGSSIAVHCVPEATGIAVWHVRVLEEGDSRGLVGFVNGRYLMRFFAERAKLDAIEYAVKLASSGVGCTYADRIVCLDTLALDAMGSRPMTGAECRALTRRKIESIDAETHRGGIAPSGSANAN